MEFKIVAYFTDKLDLYGEMVFFTRAGMCMLLMKATKSINLAAEIEKDRGCRGR